MYIGQELPELTPVEIVGCEVCEAGSPLALDDGWFTFYKSETYKTLQETGNGLWAELAEYIADRYYNEISSIVLENG